MSFFTLSSSAIKWLFKCWPPFWFTGIRFDHISHDFRHIRMVMPLRFYNQNLHSMHFGGSLYAMTDPCYLMMILRNLGTDYRVLDKSASIEYIKPGVTSVSAEMTLSDEDLNDIKDHTASGDKYLKEFCIEVKDANNETIARIIKTLYIRKKQSRVVSL
jgi:acyl-coenzyme A thioesterase PaaI-like protein